MRSFSSNDTGLQVRVMLIGVMQAFLSRRGRIAAPGLLQLGQGRPLGFHTCAQEFARRHARFLRPLRTVGVDVPGREALRTSDGGRDEDGEDQRQLSHIGLFPVGERPSIAPSSG